MRPLFLILVAPLLVSGCHKDQPQISLITGTCSYSVPTIYTGMIAPGLGPQTVSITAKMEKQDKVDVYLCRNADCTVAPVPAVGCASLTLAQQVHTPCSTRGANVLTSIQPQTVTFTKAGIPMCSSSVGCPPGDIPPYSSYVITESLCH